MIFDGERLKTIMLREFDFSLTSKLFLLRSDENRYNFENSGDDLEHFEKIPKLKTPGNPGTDGNSFSWRTKELFKWTKEFNFLTQVKLKPCFKKIESSFEQLFNISLKSGEKKSIAHSFALLLAPRSDG